MSWKEYEAQAKMMDPNFEPGYLNQRIHKMIKRDNELDSFVLEIRGEEYTRDVGAFADAFRRVLQTISDHDPRPEGGRLSTESLRDSNTITKNGWSFDFATPKGVECGHLGGADVPLFLITFAPFYKVDHARHMFPTSETKNSAFIVFSTRDNFNLQNVGASTMATEAKWYKSEADTKAKPFQDQMDRIRHNFKKKGRQYFVPDQEEFPIAFNYIPYHDKTSGTGENWLDKPIRWWEQNNQIST